MKDEVTKIKIFESDSIQDLQDKINEFIPSVRIKDISFTSSNSKYYAILVYVIGKQVLNE